MKIGDIVVKKGARRPRLYRLCSCDPRQPQLTGSVEIAKLYSNGRWDWVHKKWIDVNDVRLATPDEKGRVTE